MHQSATDEETVRPRQRARRELLIACVVIVVSAIPPLERMRVSGFISDDVSWLVALHTWRPGSGTLVLVENTYLLHVPLLVAIDVLLPSSPWSLLAGALILHAAGLWLIVWFARAAIAEIHHTTIEQLPLRTEFVALAAVVTYQVLTPAARAANAGLTTRNLETGLALVLLWWFHELVAGRRRLDGTGRQGAAAAIIALLALNDPFVVVTVIAAAVGWVVLLAVRAGRSGGSEHDVRRSFALIGPIAAGLIGWQLLRLLLHRAGVRQADSPEGLATPDEWWSHLRPVVGGVGRLAGRGLVRDDAWFIRLIGVIALVVAVVSVAWVVVAWFTSRAASVEQRGRPGLAMIALLWLAVVTVTYWASTAGASQASIRYIVAGLPALPVAVAVTFASRFDRARSLLWVLAPLAVLVAGTIGIVRDDDDRQDAMQDAAQAIEALGERGYTRGYSGYWSGPIVTYYGDFTTPVLAIQCRDGFNVPFEMLADLGEYDRAIEQPATRSFILVDSDRDRALACPPDRLEAQHGEPDDRVPAGAEMELWLYEGRDVVVDVLVRADWDG